MPDYHSYDARDRAHHHALAIRHHLARRIHGRDNVSLRSQMVRAADSIVFNLVEGSSAMQREFARCLRISITSANALQQQLELAHGDGLIESQEWTTRLNEETITIRRLIWGLGKRILADLQKP